MPRFPAYAGLLIAALAMTIGASCTGKVSTRGDLVLIVADRAPTSASPLFDGLKASALIYEGELDFPTELADSKEALLRELLTGKRDGQREGKDYEWLLSLPQSAQLSGYRSLVISDHHEVLRQVGVDEHFDYDLFAVTGTEPADHGAETALTALNDDYEARGIGRARTFFLADLLGAGAQLEPTLAAIHGELYGQADPADATRQSQRTLCILFTAPDSRLRAVIAGPGVAHEIVGESVAPRDVFPTLGRRGQIKVTAYLKGVVVPGFLSGRDLIHPE